MCYICRKYYFLLSYLKVFFNINYKIYKIVFLLMLFIWFGISFEKKYKGIILKNEKY